MPMVETEGAFPITQLPGRLPRLRPGRKIAISTIYRWMQQGVRGVRLQTVLVGGTRMVTPAAVERFMAQLNGEPATATPSHTRQREADIAAAEAVCEAAGI